jgi:hypothetical protein
MNYFEALNQINVSDKTEQKNGLTYLSWAWAWAELKKRHPLSYYTVYENENGWNYHTDGRTCWVKTGVTVIVQPDIAGVMPMDLEHVEYLPVMDYRNNSIPADKVTSMDVNKAIQRSLTKACARHGIGLYIYAGEDLPEQEQEKTPVEPVKIKVQKPSDPPKVSLSIDPVEYKRRRDELKSLMQTYDKSNEDYKAIAGDRDIKAMTSQEFDTFKNELTNRWLVS